MKGCICADFQRALTAGDYQGQVYLTHDAAEHDLTLCSLTDMSSPLDLLRVELNARKTCFWRRQKGKPDTYLATIEAIYYFLKDFHEHCLAEEYNGEYDNLLFFYSYLHSVVNKAKISAGKC